MKNTSLPYLSILSILTVLIVAIALVVVPMNEVMIAFTMIGSTVFLGASYFVLRDKDAKALQQYQRVLRQVSEDIIENKPYPDDLPEELYFSELKRLSKEMERINEKYDTRKGQLEAILNSLRNGLVAIDNQEKIIFSNPRFNELYHVREDLKELHVASNVYDKNILDVIELLEKESFVEKKHVEQTNGLVYTYRGFLILSQGKTMGKIISIENVTKVAMLDSMKQMFVSNVTHELKTPLTSIRGFAETLQSMRPDDEKYHEFLSIIEREAERLNHLIGDILTLSELEATAMMTPHEPVDVAPIVEEVTTLLQHQLRPDVSFHVDVDETIQVPMDAFQVRQLLMNLVANAIKYTDRGSVGIRFLVEHQRTVLQVVDTGIGIPDTEQGRIFERFYRVDKDRSRATGGTGLGLSIVKHIVENNRCQIFLESVVGEGTTVSVVFPPQSKRK